MSVWVEVQLCGWKDECLGGGTVGWVEGRVFGWRDRCGQSGW